MKPARFLSFLFILLTVYPSFGSCPTIPLGSFDKERGFTDVMAYKDDKTGMTRFQITMNPKTFLSHFKHAFPAERAQARITLRAKNTENFRGVTVEYGRVSFGDPDFQMTFEVPSVDLERYELEFDCSVSPEGNIPVIGGEINIATLQAIRDAKNTVTEASPIWRELEEEHKKLLEQRDSRLELQREKPPKRTEQAVGGNRR